MDDLSKPDWLPRVLRGVALAVIVVCALAMVFGMLPGTAIYRDANDCFGHALGSLFSAHGGGGHCEAHYKLIGTKPAGGFELALALLLVVLGALAVRRWPRPLVAGLWPVGAFVLLVIGAIVTLDFDIFSLEHKVPLWPSYVVSALLGLIALVMMALVVAMPIISIRRALARRRAAREAFPEARVV
jgi:hypothetical protein